MKANLTLTTKEILDKVHALIVVLSHDGSVEYVNKHTAELLGYSKDFIVGKNWFDNFIPPENRPASKARFKAFVRQKQSKEKLQEQYVKTKAGELHLVEWHNSVLQDKEKKHIRTFSSGEDVTEKHMIKLYLAEQQERHRRDRLNAILEATEKERRFLAYELHDGVNQVLTTCKLLLESELAAGSKSDFVRRSSILIQEVINNIRELSHELNPAALGNEGLHEAAREIVERINAAGKLSVGLKIIGVPCLENLCPKLSLSLLRIMQEALTNIMRHSEAENVDIDLIGSDTAVDVEIRDDGKGFDSKDSKSGLGLKTIYTRAEAAGGKAIVDSQAGLGTLLSVHIPLVSWNNR